MLICGWMAIGRAEPVSFARSFFRAGQSYLLWKENAAAPGYNVYRSTSPITTESIASLKPLELNGQRLVIWQGSAKLPICGRFYNPKPYPDSLIPQEVYDFTAFTRWSVDEVARETPGSAPMVAQGVGMLVWTPAADPAWTGDGTAYYAVTEDGSKELGPDSVVQLGEKHERLRPLLVWQSPTRKTRLFLQYAALKREDGVDWNPSEFGYAFHFSVEVPEDYDYGSQQALPVYYQLHSGGGESLPSELKSHTRLIRITPNDRYFTWWYGWEMTHDYHGIKKPWNVSTPGDGVCVQDMTFTIPQKGVIVNYMEQASLRPLFDVADDPDYRLDEDRVFVEGASMGASGAMQFGLRYPKLFSIAIADKPPMNPRLSSTAGAVCHVRVDDPISLCNEPFDFLRLQFEPMWGTTTANLPTITQSPYLGATTREPAAKDLEEFNGVGVYDWMDLGAIMSGKKLDAEGKVIGIQLPNLLGRDTAFFNVATGYRDCAASWDTQGRPLWAQMERARVGHAGTATDIGHAIERNVQSIPWPEFVPPAFSYVASAFPLNCTDSPWVSCFTVPRTQSFPALTYTEMPELEIGRQTPTPLTDCPQSGDPNSPAVLPPFYFHLNVVWDGLRDEAGLWSATLRTVARKVGTADMAAEPVLVAVTPRRTQQFHPAPGAPVYYLIERPGRLPLVGRVTWKDRLPTVPSVLVTPASTRVTLSLEWPTEAAVGPVGVRVE